MKWLKRLFGFADYDEFARSLRRLRDETEEYGGDFQPLAEMAREMLKKPGDPA